MDLEKISYQPQEMWTREAEAQERPMIQPVQSAERHVRFPSSLMDPGQCIAAIASRSESLQGRPEGAKLFDYIWSIIY